MVEGLIDPEEERRRREVMREHGVRDSSWAFRKVVEQSDVQRGQNRLLITKTMVQEAAGCLSRMFPELEQLRDDGKNAENELKVKILSADGVEKVVVLRFLNSNKAYRIKGSEWREFVEEGGFSRGDRLDLYTCKRGDDGERCLFCFRSKGGAGAAAGGSPRGINARKRSRLPQVAVSDPAAHVVTNGVRADDDNGSGKRDAIGSTARDGNHRGNTRSHQGGGGKDHKRAKNGHAKEEDMRLVINGNWHACSSKSNVHACTGDSRSDCYCVARSNHAHHECCKAETMSQEEEQEARRLWDNASSDDKAAAKGLLMLKWAA